MRNVVAGNVVAFLLMAVGAALPVASHGRGPASSHARLDSPAAASRWERDALRDALRLLADLHQVDIFLDRRINPDAKVSGSFPASSLGNLLEAIGGDLGFSVTSIDSVAYLGPAATARRLRTLDTLRRSEVRKLPPRWAGRLLAKDTFTWGDLASPRGLVEQVCRRAGVSLTNKEQIPHDLWAANRLSHVTRATQLTILLAGFDLTFDCRNDGTILLRPIREDERWEHVYRLPAGGPRLVEQLGRRLPSATLTVDGNQLHVAAWVEEHEVVQEWLKHGRRPPESARRVAETVQERRYHMRVVRRPLSEVLREIERNTAYRFDADQEAITEADLSLERLVSFEVQEVDLDGLLKALEEQSGLVFRRDGTKINVSVRP